MTLDTTLSVMAALMPLLVPATLFLYHLAVAHLPENQRAHVEHEVTLIVQAVEQTYKGVPGSGSYKKAEVQRLVNAAGLKVDPSRLDVLIESAVASVAKR